MKFLKENDFPLKYIRGLGSDGARNMSGGVQARIKEHSPLAIAIDSYIYFSGHSSFE